MNSEGRALTEIVLRLQNRAQSFLRGHAPAWRFDRVGGSRRTAGQAGHGQRRHAFASIRPGSGRRARTMSFVYVHSGAPFARKGEQQMALPKMDIPIGLVEWEVFVPDRFSVSKFGGNMITGDYITVTSPGGGAGHGVGSGSGRGVGEGNIAPALGAAPGQIVGRITDETVRCCPA